MSERPSILEPDELARLHEQYDKVAETLPEDASLDQILEAANQLADKPEDENE